MKRRALGQSLEASAWGRAVTTGLRIAGRMAELRPIELAADPHLPGHAEPAASGDECRSDPTYRVSRRA